MTKSNNIAVIANRENLDSQAVLSHAITAWREAGVSVVGVLARNNDGDATCSAGFLRDIVSGKEFSIQLDTPPIDTTCHLDAAGLENAGANLLGQIPSADIVVLSKFGKLEAAHEGLWPVFQAAIAAGKPLLTTVSPKHNEAWHLFAPAASWLAGDQESITQWWRTFQAGVK
jgi:nucleoside-triphosphatase THEP1